LVSNKLRAELVIKKVTRPPVSLFPCLKCPSNYGNLNLTTQVVSETLDAENAGAAPPKKIQWLKPLRWQFYNFNQPKTVNLVKNNIFQRT
jgi:hypothetical protein